MAVTVKSSGVKLLLLVIAVVLFILAAFGLKVEVNLFDLGVAATIASFIF